MCDVSNEKFAMREKYMCISHC